MLQQRFTVRDMAARKRDGQRFTMLSVYDYPTARLAEAAGVDTLLVGDSLAMTALGHPDTVALSVEEMLHHVKAVRRGADRAMVIADMPFLSYQVSTEEAVRNAGRFLKEGGADAVKVEGGRRVAPALSAIHNAGIVVMAHIGLTPQSAAQVGGLKVQGNTADAALALIDDAIGLEDAGACAVLMECVPADIARLAGEAVSVPTISYGAGPHCDCQGLVAADILGLFDDFLPRFAKRYAELGTQARQAMEAYRDDVLEGRFPDHQNCYGVPSEVVADVKAALAARESAQ